MIGLGASGNCGGAVIVGVRVGNDEVLLLKVRVGVGKREE